MYSVEAGEDLIPSVFRVYSPLCLMLLRMIHTLLALLFILSLCVYLFNAYLANNQFMQPKIEAQICGLMDIQITVTLRQVKRFRETLQVHERVVR